jgi:hypothetical protein
MGNYTHICTECKYADGILVLKGETSEAVSMKGGGGYPLKVQPMSDSGI